MEAESVDALPREPGWRYEPKWDGFRCLAFRDGDSVELRAKSGKPLARYFPESWRPRRRAGRAVRVGRRDRHRRWAGSSFDALQMRLHPAESRVRKLAAETPAR